MPAEHERITNRRGSHAKTRANIAEAIRRGVVLRAGIIGVDDGQRIEQARAELEALGVRRITVDYLRRIGLSQDHLAQKIAYSASLVAMVESRRRMPSLDFAKRCDDALATGGALARLHPLVAGEAYPAWFRPFVELERAATSLRAWEPLLVPGLLQTEEYARAILRASRPRDTDAAIDELVTARLARQEILSGENPPDLWVIIDEGALRRPVGGPAVMAAQLDRLLETGRAPWVTVQVMPESAGAHPGLLGAFVIAGFAAAPDVAYLDSVLTGQVVERPDDVRQVVVLYDTMRAEALPPAASAALISEVVRTWT